jgi:hypothetical protein
MATTFEILDTILSILKLNRGVSDVNGEIVSILTNQLELISRELNTIREKMYDFDTLAQKLSNLETRFADLENYDSGYSTRASIGSNDTPFRFGSLSRSQSLPSYESLANQHRNSDVENRLKNVARKLDFQDVSTWL